MSTTPIHKLLEKTGDYDSAERYMATADLCNLLSQESFKLDSTTEKLVVSAVLKQLDDKSNDVQSVAVKCLAILLKKVQEEQVGDICEKLCLLILQEEQAMLRDIYSIGLKTLISDVPERMGSRVSSKLTGRLLHGISGQHSDDIRRECLENLSELLRRFGHLVLDQHEGIMSIVLGQLVDNSKAVIRKKAALCLGSLAVVSSDALLNRLVERLLELIEPPAGGGVTKGDTRTLIQTIGTISRTVGYRLGRHLGRLIPLVIKFCGNPDDESQQNDATNELREHCFPGLESFVLRCPREVTPYLDEILALSFSFMKYDPNYSYCDEDENDKEEDDDTMDQDNDGYGEDDDEGGREGDGGGYGGSDDDDTSWKVRKAAIKVISAVVHARPDMLDKLYEEYLEALVSRFKEREENVRLDVLQCLGSMLQASLVPPISANASIGSSKVAPPPHLVLKTDHLIIAARKQLFLSSASIRTKSTVFSVLRTLVQVIQGNFDRHLKDLVGDVIKCSTNEKNQALKLDALLFLNALFEQHAPEVMQPYVSVVLPHVLNAIKEDWYKIIAEALRVLGVLIVTSRPRDPSGEMFLANTSHYGTALAAPIYSAIFSRLEVHDIDQEIKECAIAAMGRLFANFGDELAEHLPTVLDLLKRRMENDITRTPTLKALDMLARSPLALDLSPVLQQSALDLSHFLRQQSRVLKQQTLVTLNSLVCSPSSSLTNEMSKTLLFEAAQLVSEADLHLAHLTLRLTQAILAKHPSSADGVFAHIYQPAIELCGSPLLQGQSQRTLVLFLHDLVSLGAPNMAFDDIFSALYSLALTSSSSALSQNQSSSSQHSHSVATAAAATSSSSSSSKQSVTNLAMCIAGICAQVEPSVRNKVVAKLASDLSPGDESRRHLALLCIGELGQTTDLASAVAVDLKALILTCFDSHAEETKTAAAFALGHLAVGNMANFLPALLQSLPGSKHQYLLLASLKEIILVHADTGLSFDAFVQDVLNVLKHHVTAEEEGVRNMVAECLGLVTFMQPLIMVRILVQMLDEFSQQSQGLARWTITTSLRFALTRPVAPDSLATFKDALRCFMPFLSSEDLEVRKAALLLVNTTVYYNSHALFDLMQHEINPHLVATLKFKQERVVDLGPFKHKVDDGLPLRKVALTCTETMLEACSEKMDLGYFLHAIVEYSFPDEQLKVQAHQIACKMCQMDANVMFPEIELLVPALEKTIVGKKSSKPQQEAPVGPEAERALEVVKSALRVVIVVNALPDIKSNRVWSEFLARLEAAPVAHSLLTSMTDAPKSE